MFQNPFSFKGRIRRTEYALSYLLFLFVLYAGSFLITSLDHGGYNIVLLYGAMYWFMFSQGTKRCHDLGNNGFYQLIPFYGFILIFSEGLSRSNQYGPDPKLTELRLKQQTQRTKPDWKDLPKGKNLETIGSELLSGTLLTTLVVVLFNYVLEPFEFLRYLTETLVVMGGYFGVIYISMHGKLMPKLPWYFILHRAAFSVLWYLFYWSYEAYFKLIGSLNYDAIGGDLLYIVSVFILTYLPFLLYKICITPKEVYVEP